MTVSKERREEIYKTVNSALSDLLQKDIALGVGKDNRTNNLFVCAIDIPSETIFPIGDHSKKRPIS